MVREYPSDSHLEARLNMSMDLLCTRTRLCVRTKFTETGTRKEMVGCGRKN